MEKQSLFGKLMQDFCGQKGNNFLPQALVLGLCVGRLSPQGQPLPLANETTVLGQRVYSPIA